MDECNDPPGADDPDANRCKLFEDYMVNVVTELNKKNIEGVDLTWRRPARCNKGKENKYTTPHNIIQHSVTAIYEPQQVIMDLTRFFIFNKHRKMEPKFNKLWAPLERAHWYPRVI